MSSTTGGTPTMVSPGCMKGVFGLPVSIVSIMRRRNGGSELLLRYWSRRVGRSNRHSRSHARVAIGLVERQARRLTRIDCSRRHANQRSDGRRFLPRRRHLHPLMDTRVELVGGNVLRGDGAGIRPITGERVCKRQVLADASVGVGPASGWLQDLDRIVRTSGKRHRQTVIGWVEHAAAGFEEAERFVALAESDLDLIVCGTTDSVLMIEAGASQVQIGSLASQ